MLDAFSSQKALLLKGTNSSLRTIALVLRQEVKNIARESESNNRHQVDATLLKMSICPKNVLLQQRHPP